jgi:uncharacterized membrane protein
MMGGWGELGVALALFIAAHLLPARPAVRSRLAAVLGERLYLALYSLVSLALLGWLITAAGTAPYVPLWEPAPWQRWTAALLMAPACLLLTLGIGVPSPLSLGGGTTRSDPEHPGIVGIVRHPLLWALALWSAAHLLANGDLAHILLFGGFLALALAGMAALDRRSRARLGVEEWRRLAMRRPPGWRRSDLARLAAGFVLYVMLLLAHEPVIGIAPLALSQPASVAVA